MNMIYEEFLKRVGLKIKYYRMLKNITQNILAESLSVEESYMSDIENGKRNITMKTLYNIASALNIDCVKLFDFND